MLGDARPVRRQVASPDRPRELQIRFERPALEPLERTSIRHLAHQQLHENRELLNLDPKAHGCRGWGFALRLHQFGMSIGIIQL